MNVNSILVKRSTLNGNKSNTIYKDPIDPTSLDSETPCSYVRPQLMTLEFALICHFFALQDKTSLKCFKQLSAQYVHLIFFIDPIFI